MPIGRTLPHPSLKAHLSRPLSVEIPPRRITPAIGINFDPMQIPSHPNRMDVELVAPPPLKDPSSGEEDIPIYLNPFSKLRWRWQSQTTSIDRVLRAKGNPI